MTSLRIAVAHDYCTQRGGAERVALAILKSFPQSRLFTAAWEEGATYPEFANFPVTTSFLQRIPMLRRDPRLALPLLPLAIRSLRVTGADVVICSSSGWSHGVRAAAPKVVYCHNPPRWLYQSREYLHGLPRAAAYALRAFRPLLVRWDRRVSKEAVLYVANSSVVADRIERVYGRRPRVLHPPVSVDLRADRTPISGIAPGFLLTVARGRGYKRVGVVVEAMESLQGERLVVVGQSVSSRGSNVSSFDHVTDGELRWLYANAKALVSVAEEDFGLTPIEANAFGTPALVLRAGGFLDSIIDGVNGKFIDSPTPEAVAQAVSDLPASMRGACVARAVERFSVTAFRQGLLDVIEEAQAGATG